MNFSHLRTITWLRWRLFVNSFRKIGRGHKIFSIVILVGSFLTAILMGWAGWSIELSFLTDAPASMYLLIWAGIVVIYLFTWSIGVLTDLQRKEPLTLSKFLHLPVSPANAFVNNFLSSFLSISTILILPVMLGFSLRMVAMFGPRLVPGVLLLMAFVLMVVALTYQFRGWLAM